MWNFGHKYNIRLLYEVPKIPIYDYECKKCGNTHAENLKIADRNAPTLTPCPSCGGEVIKVMLGAPAMGDAIRLGITRPDSGMKEVLQRVHERTPGSRLKDVSNLTRL